MRVFVTTAAIRKKKKKKRKKPTPNNSKISFYKLSFISESKNSKHTCTCGYCIGVERILLFKHADLF